MRAHRLRVRLPLFFLALVAATFVRCGSGGKDDTEGKVCEGALPDERRIVYGGDASDEAIERVWDKRCEAKEDPDWAPRIASPALDEEVSVDQPFTLSWDQRTTLRLSPGEAPVPGPTTPWISFGFAEAYAHLPPVTDWVQLFELRPENGEPLWVFTTERSWTPDAVVWREIKEWRGRVEVRALAAYLRKNVVDEGPYVPTSVHSFRMVEK